MPLRPSLLLPLLPPPSSTRQLLHSLASSGFSDPALYHTSRPSYPPPAIQQILARARPTLSSSNKPAIMELGAGTGLFTAPFLEALKNGHEEFQYVANEPGPLGEALKRIEEEEPVSVMSVPLFPRRRRRSWRLSHEGGWERRVDVKADVLAGEGASRGARELRESCGAFSRLSTSLPLPSFCVVFVLFTELLHPTSFFFPP